MSEEISSLRPRSPRYLSCSFDAGTEDNRTTEEWDQRQTTKPKDATIIRRLDGLAPLPYSRAANQTVTLCIVRYFFISKSEGLDQKIPVYASFWP